MKINCIAIDDEPLALDVIEHHVNKIPFINLKAKISNAFDAIDYLCNNQVDLIFLDIQMPDLTGFELLNSLLFKIDFTKLSRLDQLRFEIPKPFDSHVLVP